MYYHYGETIANLVKEATSICQQSNRKVTDIGFDDCSKHRDFIVWSYVKANNDSFEEGLIKGNIVKTETCDINSSLELEMIRERINKSVNETYIDLSNKIVNYIHDNKQGAYNASIGRVFGFDKYFNSKDQKDRAIACVIQMMVDRGILRRLKNEHGKTPLEIISGKEFTPVKLFDITKKKYDSKYEARIADIFEEIGVAFRPQEKFVDCKDKRCLPFDFFLPEYEALVEVQGEQHYEPLDIFGGVDAFIKRLEHDGTKRKYAEDNDYAFIAIPYNHIKHLNVYNIKQYIESNIEPL